MNRTTGFSSSRLNRKAVSQVLSPVQPSCLGRDHRGKLPSQRYYEVGNPHREMLSGSRCTGFSLFEMLLVVSLVTLISLIGVPSLQTQLAKHRADSTISRLQSLFRFAETQSLKRGVKISLCPSFDGKSCGGDWAAGQMVFIDSDNTHQPNNQAAILRVAPKLSHGRLWLRAFPQQGFLQWSPTRPLAGQNGTFLYCPSQPDSHLRRALVFNQTGRLRVVSGETVSLDCV